MYQKDLELQNKKCNTALCLAAAAGNVKVAMIIVNKNKGMLEMPGSEGKTPIYIAASSAKHDMVRYLYDNSQKMFWTDDNRGTLLLKCVEADLFDIAVNIVNDYDGLTTDKRLLTDVLLLLAQKTNAFIDVTPKIISRIISLLFRLKVGHAVKESDALKLLRIIWKKMAIMSKNEIDDIFQGLPSIANCAKSGTNRNRTHSSRVDDHGLSIFHKAVRRRHAMIYNLLYEIGSRKDLITHLEDKNGNNMLHLIGKSTKPKRLMTMSGVALQMQRELLWFKEVEQMIPHNYRQRKNKDGDTPLDLFTKKHADLVIESEEWMKSTASQCMVVATLIATMVFAAAFTLPGGYNQDTGIPIFSQKAALIVFVISDAVSLIFSSTSVLMFLSILTSRYAEGDFLESLPKKLMLGLASLFISISTMMVAFSSSFFILYKENLYWVPIMVTSLAAVPVILYAILQFRLLKDVFNSTYQSRYLFKPKKHILY
ncbi:ankyrin repeat-containing protein [Tanacetum coccineum]